MTGTAAGAIRGLNLQGQGGQRRFELVGDVGQMIGKHIAHGNRFRPGAGQFGDGFAKLIRQAGQGTLGR